jgi:hypothetical protein
MNGVYNGGAGGSHHEPDPALYAWAEVTGSFLASCQELQLGELLHDDMFGLFEVSFFLSCARSSIWASFFRTICSGFSRWAFFASVVDPYPAVNWLSWIRSRIGNADTDPGAWKLTKLIFSLSKSRLWYLRRYVFDLLSIIWIRVHLAP